VAFSRLASIQLCSWMERRLGLTIIEYDTEKEYIAIWLAINSMLECLVESKNSSYRYANGYLPHMCTNANEGSSTTPRAPAHTGLLGWRKIPMPDPDMLKTPTPIPDINLVCTLCSVALGFLFGICMGIISGLLMSYLLLHEISVTFVVMIGGPFGTIVFILFVWRVWSELESAAGYGQALQWAKGCSPTE